MSVLRSMNSQVGRALFGVVLLSFSMTSACTTTGGGPTPINPGEPGAHGDQPEGWGEGDSRDELKARLTRLVEQQRVMATAAAASAGACEDICSLATSICGVQEKLCSIADEHPGEDEYQGLCREAKQECRAAQDDCIGCVEKHTKSGSTEGASASSEAATSTATEGGATEIAVEPAADTTPSSAD